MCPWVGPHAPSFRRQLWGLPSCVEYLSPQGVLIPLVYGTTASPLWLELRGLSAWQATPSWTAYRLACRRLLPWLQVTFAMVPDAAWPGSDQWPWGTAPAAGPVGQLGRPSASDPWGVGSFLSFGRPTCARVCGVLGHLAPLHRCARSVRCFACAVSWATWLLFTSVSARCVVLRVRCPGPLGSCSPVCPLGALLCVCGVVGHLASVHRCTGVVCCVASAVSWATWLLFTGVPAQCVALLLQCPGPLGSCSPVYPLGVLCCVCGVLGYLAPVHRCARSVPCFHCAVSWAAWLLFTGVPARCVVLCVRCPGPLGSCSPVCPLGALLCVCGVLGHLAPVHRCARLVCCVVCAVSWATWLLFTSAPTRCVALLVRCPGPLGSCSLVCPLRPVLCSCGALGHLAPVHRCARSVCCVACAVSWATWLLFTSVPALCALLRVRRPRPLGSCSLVCPLGVLCCVCGVLGYLAPVHRCARSLLCFACAVSWEIWLLFTGAPARCVALLVRCPGLLGSCCPVCSLAVLCCVSGVLGHLAPVHRCARSVLCFPCALSWAPWLLFTGVPARCVVLHVRCTGPLGSCSPFCPLGVLCCVCGVLGHLAPVHRCARSVCSVARAVSWASWLLFTGVPARCVVLRVPCPWPLGSCSLVCSLRVLCWVCGVLGLLTPVHRCACTVCCAVGCVCGASLRGAHSSIRTAAIRGRQGLGLLPGAHLSIRTAAVHSRQGLGTLRARTRLSGRRLFRRRQGLGSLPGAHTSVWTAAGVAWHLFSCRGSLRVLRALRVCGTRRPLLLGACPCALAVAGGLPLWRASWPRMVRRASSGPVALCAPVGFPDAVVPFPTPGACPPGFTGWLRGARGGRPRTRLIVPAAGPRGGRGAGLAPHLTLSGPRDGVVPGGSLRHRSWAACAAVVGVCGPGH